MKNSGIISLLLSFGALFTPDNLPAANDRYRTDINPALLYWQAWAEIPALPDSDHGYLFTNEWFGQKLPERFGSLLKQYDNSFKLLRRASHAQVPCVWGYDLSDGPDALLPGLAKAKSLAQAARLRALWDLQQGNEIAARDDLLAAFIQARNAAKDRILITSLVQFAIENIIERSIAENYYRFSSETFRQLLDGIDTGPARGTIAECIPNEKISFADWLLVKLEEFPAAGTPEQLQEMIRGLFPRDQGEADDHFGDRLFKAAGGTQPGLVRLVKEMEPWYNEVRVILTLPYKEYQPRIAALNERMESEPNPLIKHFFGLFDKCRQKEFASEIRLRFFHAALAFRDGGEGALGKVLDPITQEPFAWSRFTFDGVDRGFELRSKFTGRGFSELEIFVEKEGPAFAVEGINAGRKIK